MFAKLGSVKLESIRVNFKQCALWSALQTGDEFNISDYLE